MTSQLLLRLEGALVLLGSLFVYAVVDSSWALFFVLLSAPDVFMVGYLAGPVAGAYVYNAGHTCAGPFITALVSYGTRTSGLSAIAVKWTAHIPTDRTLGYGLKEPTGFHDTHLNSPAQPHTSGAQASV